MLIIFNKKWIKWFVKTSQKFDKIDVVDYNFIVLKFLDFIVFYMIFRPSDDVLDQIAEKKDWQINSDNQILKNDWQQLFYPTEWIEDNSEFSNNLNLEWNWLENSDSEEIKAPDLSELLKKSDSDFGGVEDLRSVNEKIEQNNLENLEDSDQLESEDSDGKLNIVEHLEEWSWENSDLDVIVPGKMSDEERIDIVSKIEGSKHSNLDLLIDDKWRSLVNNYKKVHRFVFRWWMFTLFSIIWVLFGIVFQLCNGQSNNYAIINENSISNKHKWLDSSETTLSDLKEKWVETVVSYWSARINGNVFQSKSNLVLYNWIVLPQVISMNYENNKLSLDNFNDGKMSREDLKNVLQTLVIDESIYKKTRDMVGAMDTKREWQEIEWWLIDGFSLWCLWKNKLSDFFCDKFLDVFNNYGKFYDLSRYSSDLTKIVKELKKQNKDIEPICEMVKEYTLHVWNWSSDSLSSIMDYCEDKDVLYYKKIINFIEIENSLNQPELSDKVFDDPDLNAYKLLSAQQSVYKILDGSTLNKNYIVSYLNFVQALINKDKWTNKYLAPLYLDLIYVFDMDELYEKLLAKWELSSDLKSKIDQINNGNSIYNYVSLLKLIKNKDIIKSVWDFSWSVVQSQSLEEIFAQYYNMTDQLRIRNSDTISENEIRAQMEIYSDKILSATQWETLKSTVVLYRKDNVLYVKNIKIAGQSAFSDILNIRASEADLTFYAMLAYIDEQISFWYNRVNEESDLKPNLCDGLSGNSAVILKDCSDSSVSIIKWDVEYNFVLNNWILEWFTVNDESLYSQIREKLWNIMVTENDTQSIILSIIDFELEQSSPDNVDKKLQVVDQFRIHFKMIPEVYDIEWEDEKFLVKFTLWEFDLQANYDINTRMLTKISYIACNKTLEIRNLNIEISANNEAQLIEILNNPRIFLTRTNESAYRKYLTMCEKESEE